MHQIRDEDIHIVSPPPPPSLMRRALRFFLLFGAASGFVFATAFDLKNDRVLTRSARCVVSGATILAMYKFTSPETPEQISDMHTRAARALLDLCVLNEGLYIKLGQQVHSLNQILPPEYSRTLRVLLDSAPDVPVEVVRRTVEEDLGRSVEELFVEWDPKPVASASIAQVHRAKLRTADGQLHDVAVKVQKPNIRRQMWWDLQCYFLFCFCVHRGFGLPVWWSAQHIAEKLTLEIDFTKEASHIKYARHLLLGEHIAPKDVPPSPDPTENGAASAHHAPRSAKDVIKSIGAGAAAAAETDAAVAAARKPILGKDAGDVYVPRVFDEALSPRVLVTEWIDSVKLHQTEKVIADYDVPAVMDTVVRSFADLVFLHGFVHADPHPANVLLRPHPKYVASGTDTPVGGGKHKHHQVVYIDWGLATRESAKFKREYAQLFAAIFVRDEKTIVDTISSWGISDPQLFASLMMQKPVSLGKNEKPVHTSKVTKEQVLEMQRRMKDKVATLLEDDSKTPKELILLGRGMNLIRSVNKSFGAPVNRVNILAEGAARALGANGGALLGSRIAALRFHASLAYLNFVFLALQYYAALLNWFSFIFTGHASTAQVSNIETVIDEVERQIVREHSGMTVSEKD